MSLYLRNFQNKFTSLVNTRKQVTKVDYHVPKHVQSFLFSEKLLGAQTSSNGTNYDLITKPPRILNKRYNWNPQRIICLQKQRQKTVKTLNGINYNIVHKAIVKSCTQRPEFCIDSNNFYKDKNSCLSHTELLSIHRSLDTSLLNSGEQRIFYSEISPNVQNENVKQSSDDRKPTEEQLQHVFDCLSKDLPMLFIRTMNYSIYTQDIIFINNIRGITTTGLLNYIKQIAFLKIIGHLKFAYVKLDILKITMHPEDNSIKVRWRIIGITGTNVFLSFWKFRLWNFKEYLNNREAWYDGFSTFYVNNDGKVFKHVVDKLLPDQDAREKVKTPIATKLAVFTALLGLDSYNCIKLTKK
ncbi:uncharacterized protein LOC143178621 [Calliopsis andreniformis]|uniref:uncharacterized protein LOC143178621 n=1 Tax=Calliopsis andreniformis TaxID=337506 RepID=UPI003FCE72ED